MFWLIFPRFYFDQHINELSGNIDLNKILNKAEAIYIQVKNSTKLTDDIRRIIGELPSKATTDEGSRSDDEKLMDGVVEKNGFSAHSDSDTSPGSSDREAIYEMGINQTFYWVDLKLERNKYFIPHTQFNKKKSHNKQFFISNVIGHVRYI